MCLTINKVFNTKEEALAYPASIATEDIKVYKVLIGKKILGIPFGNMAPYRDFHYTRRKKYRAKFGRTTSYTFPWTNDDRFSLDIDEGLHAYVEKKDAMKLKEKETIVVQMTIPKGSEYYLGTRGDIVSNCLIYK